jgi:choline transport protein
MNEYDAEKRVEVPLREKDMEKRRESIAEIIEEKNIEGTVDGITVNASGHRDELQRHFSIWSLCGLALTIDNAWG